MATQKDTGSSAPESNPELLELLTKGYQKFKFPTTEETDTKENDSVVMTKRTPGDKKMVKGQGHDGQGGSFEVNRSSPPLKYIIKELDSSPALKPNRKKILKRLQTPIILPKFHTDPKTQKVSKLYIKKK